MFHPPSFPPYTHTRARTWTADAHTHTPRYTSSMGFRFDFFWTPARPLRRHRYWRRPAPARHAVVVHRTVGAIVLFTAGAAGSGGPSALCARVCVRVWVYVCVGRAGRGGASVFTHRLSRRLLFSAPLVFVQCLRSPCYVFILHAPHLRRGRSRAELCFGVLIIIYFFFCFCVLICFPKKNKIYIIP